MRAEVVLAGSVAGPSSDSLKLANRTASDGTHQGHYVRGPTT